MSHTKAGKPQHPTFADDLRSMMTAWDKIQTVARQTFPHASEHEIYEITSHAMKHALGAS